VAYALCRFESGRRHQNKNSSWLGLPGIAASNKQWKTERMLENYLPILIFIVIGLIFGILPLILGRLIAPYRPSKEKLAPYECGFEAFEDARMKFDVRYYLVAILFIIFDLEIAFLFPWAVVLDEIGWKGFWAIIIFLLILVVGFIYEWKKGALEWE
jgi:NADH-quinone oxidoreductase subunit A